MGRVGPSSYHKTKVRGWVTQFEWHCHKVNLISLSNQHICHKAHLPSLTLIPIHLRPTSTPLEGPRIFVVPDYAVSMISLGLFGDNTAGRFCLKSRLTSGEFTDRLGNIQSSWNHLTLSMDRHCRRQVAGGRRLQTGYTALAFNLYFRVQV